MLCTLGAINVTEFLAAKTILSNLERGISPLFGFYMKQILDVCLAYASAKSKISIYISP